MSDINLQEIEQAFYKKFKQYPMITYEEVQGYGKNVLIWKIPTIGGENQILFYKIGKDTRKALWFIENWKYCPNGLKLFDSEKEKAVYQLEIELVKLKKNP